MRNVASPNKLAKGTVLDEATVQLHLAQYLKLQYPRVLFRSDYASGLKLTIAQAKRHKSLQSGRAWPDIFIAEPRGGYHGLFIEVKRDGTRLYLRNGEPATPHIAEQAEVLNQLRLRGYQAAFGVGFEETKDMIDAYLQEAHIYHDLDTCPFVYK